MNKKQMVVLWIGGVLTAGAFFYISEEYPPLLGFGIAIITFLFLYTFKSKGDVGDNVKRLALGAFIFLSIATGIGLAADASQKCSDSESSCSDAQSSCSDCER